eukprot:g49714.t1
MPARWSKLGRPSAHRYAMLRTMVTQLIEHERIETTVAKAKALRPLAERMITFGKEGTKKSKRQAQAVVRTPIMLYKLFEELAPRYRWRPGGYTRILRTRRRLGDNAPMAFIEFVDRPGELRPARKVDKAYHDMVLAQRAEYEKNTFQAAFSPFPISCNLKLLSSGFHLKPLPRLPGHELELQPKHCDYRVTQLAFGQFEFSNPTLKLRTVRRERRPLQHVLKVATERPVGYYDSALKPSGQTICGGDTANCPAQKWPIQLRVNSVSAIRFVPLCPINQKD